MRTTSNRRGISVMLVLVFLALLLTLWGISYRQIASALRIQSVRSQYALRDQGNLQALAQGLTLLQSGVPPTDPYVCATTIQMPAGTQSFTLTFSSNEPDVWTVNSTATQPGETIEPMPDTFEPQTQ
jgi:hypothetical protein